MRVVLLFLLALFGQPVAAFACGPESDCILGDRTYRIAMPKAGSQGPFGALIMAHGFGGSAKAEMGNMALRALAHENRMALVAPNSVGDAWMIPHMPDDTPDVGAREFAFFDALADDLSARHGIDRSHVVMSGFSVGAMLVWNLACHRSQSFAAFVPISGTYWEPVPETCPSPVPNLVHIHGTADKVVPMVGRRVWQMRQGNVSKAMNQAMAAGGFAAANQVEQNDLTCLHRTNGMGTLLALCTHPGGHDLRLVDLSKALSLLREHGAFKRKPPPSADDQG